MSRGQKVIANVVHAFERKNFNANIQIQKNEIKIPFDAITFLLDIIMIEKVAVFFKCLICAKEQKLNKIDVHTERQHTPPRTSFKNGLSKHFAKVARIGKCIVWCVWMHQECFMQEASSTLLSIKQQQLYWCIKELQYCTKEVRFSKEWTKQEIQAKELKWLY